MTEKQIRQKVVGVMQGWVGRKEGDGSHKTIIDIYNGHKPLARSYSVKYTDAWCATCVSAAAIQAGFDDIIPLECGCGQMIQLAVKMGIWQESDAHRPEPGDIIMYDWQDSGIGDNTGWPDHIGMVENVAGNTITVIEGNMNDAVGRRNLQVNGRYIRGYILPKYEDKVTEKEPTKSVDEIALEVLAGKWGNNPERKQKLEVAGYDYSAIQAAVNQIANRKKSVATVAQEVLAGKWGNNPERKKSLEEAGYDYKTIQAEVNRLFQ